MALKEDKASKDRTSRTLPASATVEAILLAKQTLTLSGIDAVDYFGRNTSVKRNSKDGDVLKKGDVVASIKGPARGILSAERSILNLMGRMSGVATITRRFTSEIQKGSPTRILDTRKTTPGLRLVEKYAVRCGGGTNHRMDLSEMVFLKDNHLAICDLETLCEKARAENDYVIIEVETRSQLNRAIKCKPDRILLDNLTNKDVKTYMNQIRKESGKKIAIEVSGGITESRIRPLSRIGVDFISIGALTHSAPCADFSLEIK